MRPMPQDTVLAGLTEVLGDAAGVDPADVTPEARLGNDLGIDSLTMVEVVVAAEDRFGLVIADDDWSRFVTAGDVIAYIERAGIIRGLTARADASKNRLHVRLFCHVSGIEALRRPASPGCARG